MGVTAFETALLTAALFAKVEAAGLTQEQVSWASKALADTRVAERARKETSGSMLLVATAIVKSDGNEKRVDALC